MLVVKPICSLSRENPKLVKWLYACLLKSLRKTFSKSDFPQVEITFKPPKELVS